MIVELFGEEILRASLFDVKEKIKSIPSDRAERRSYLLKEYATIKGITLTKEDYQNVEPNP